MRVNSNVKSIKHMIDLNILKFEFEKALINMVVHRLYFGEQYFVLTCRYSNKSLPWHLPIQMLS